MVKKYFLASANLEEVELDWSLATEHRDENFDLAALAVDFGDASFEFFERSVDDGDAVFNFEVDGVHRHICLHTTKELSNLIFAKWNRLNT